MRTHLVRIFKNDAQISLTIVSYFAHSTSILHFLLCNQKYYYYNISQDSTETFSPANHLSNT